MVDARVQIPLDAPLQDVGKPGNPPAWGAGERRFKSDHPDLLWCGVTVACLVVTQPVKVRLLPPQLQRKGKPTGRWHPSGTRARRKPLQVRFLSLPLAGLVEQRSARHPDMVEIAGSNPAETTLLPWPSGNGGSFTRRQAQVRVLPGVLRSGLESGFQHGLISRSTPVRIRPPQVKGKGKK